MSRNRFVAFVPAVTLGFWLLILRLWLVSFFSGIFWAVIQLLLITFLLGCVAAFLSNLILPVVTDYKMAIKFATPSACVFLFLFIINDLFVTVRDSDFSIETIGFSIISFFIITFPSGILLMIGTAFFGWLGSHIKLTKKHNPLL